MPRPRRRSGARIELAVATAPVTVRRCLSRSTRSASTNRADRCSRRIWGGSGDVLAAPNWSATVASARWSCPHSSPATGSRAGPPSSPLPAPEDHSARDPDPDRRPDHRDPAETHRDRPGRRPRHHRLAAGTPPQPHRLPGYHRPAAGHRRTGHPRPEEEAKSSSIRLAADQLNECWQSDFTHYRLTRPRPPTRRRHRDPELARRPLPIRPHGHRPPPGHRTDRARQVPHSRCYTRDSRLHTHRQRHGLHHPPVRRQPARHPRPQQLRSRAPPPRHRPEELPTQPPQHLRQGRTVPTDCGSPEIVGGLLMPLPGRGRWPLGATTSAPRRAQAPRHRLRR